MSDVNKENNNDILKKYLNIYLNSRYDSDELEIIFGTFKNPITKICFNNTIKKLKSLGFNCINENGEYLLRIFTKYNDERSGKVLNSNIRTEIRHLTDIQKYCKTNSFNTDIIPPNISFLQKSNKKMVDNETLKGIIYHDFQFRVKYKIERSLYKGSRDGKINNLLDTWNDSEKMFRYIKRFTFQHNDLPYKIDFSIVKTSKKINKYEYKYEYDIQKSNIFNNVENYEIEIELIKNKCNHLTQDNLLNIIKQGIKYVLSGLQFTNYPIPYTGINSQKYIQDEYLNLIYNKKPPNRYIKNIDFIGPSSISLELNNIIQNNKHMNIPNINQPYAVTEKTDGLRKLMYVSKNGKIYLIDHNMKVQYTGCITRHRNNFNSLIDGEHVLYNKNGQYINNYLCFDIYYLNYKDMRKYPFSKHIIDTKYNKNFGDKKYRYNELSSFIKGLDMEYITKNSHKYFIVRVKEFYSNVSVDNIFIQCKKLLDGINNGTMFEYNTDGLVFTPIHKSVASNSIVEKIPVRKKTWSWSLKWKPPEHNTIDFLVTTKKNKDGSDWVGNIFQNGINTRDNSNIIQYKILTLRVGYSIKRHGYINPCEDLYQDKINNNNDDEIDYNNDYFPAPFVPTDPSPNYDIYTCYIPLKKNGDMLNMFIEDGTEIIEDESIVEFKYVNDNKKYFKFVPIKVRYDKTSSYRAFNKNYGNDYNTALSVWKCINNPVTEYMLKTGKGIPDIIDNNDVYYNTNRNIDNTTQALKDFHNRYVKYNLIHNFSKPSQILMDMTVGKAGDLSKWLGSKLSLIVGIDLSKDNIENRKDGACARYLNMRSKYNNPPKALFLTGDSSKNIKNGDAFNDDKTKNIAKSIYGIGTKDPKILGKGVYNMYGLGKNGFDIISNQFSIHYFFKNINTLQNFIHNVCENCKVNGYFIGTCYDGKKIFKLLENYDVGQGKQLVNNGHIQWEITKLYNNDDFQNNSNSLGMSINIYQESINKTIPEYLVNFEYFTRILENYGFIPAPIKDIELYGYTKPIGSFKELFNNMEDEIHNKKIYKKNIGNALNMKDNEKEISFLNNYFIFKKVRNVDPYKVNIDINERFKKVRDVVKFKRRIKII